MYFGLSEDVWWLLNVREGCQIPGIVVTGDPVFEPEGSHHRDQIYCIGLQTDTKLTVFDMNCKYCVFWRDEQKAFLQLKLWDGHVHKQQLLSLNDLTS